MLAGTGDSTDIGKPAWKYVSPMWQINGRDQILLHEARPSASCAVASSRIQGQARLEQWRETKQERSRPRIFGESNVVNTQIYL